MQIIFCVESSYEKGMGHLFRSMKLARALNNQNVTFVINDDSISCDILKKNNILYQIVNFSASNWEENVLSHAGVDVWINDRHDTSLEHSSFILSRAKKLITFDDRGPGAQKADYNICPLIFNESLPGKKVLSGTPYIIVDEELKSFQRKRKVLSKVLVALGGTDNFELTSKILSKIPALSFELSVLLGPHNTQESYIRSSFPQSKLLRNLPSLGTVFHEHDLLISGGGMMPFEALATGLPVICCASETFEKPVCQYIEKESLGYFAGFREDILNFNFARILENIKLSDLSSNGMQKVDFNAISRLKGLII